MNKKILLILVLISIFIMTTASYSEYKGTACTNFAAVSGDTVLFGNSEDVSGDHPMKNDPDATVIWFVPATDEQYGMIQLGFYFNGDQVNYQGGMNEFGLCFDSTAIPEIELIDRPDLLYNPDNSYIWKDIIGKNKNVDEAVEYVKNYNFGTMWYQLFLTDASGKTVVISPGKDGDPVFDYMDSSISFITQTNFNRSYPISHLGSYPDPRYDSSYNALSALVSSGNVNVREFESILDSVSQKGHDAYTPYSNIFDPVNKMAYIYYATQFDEAVVFNLIDELSKGEHEYKLSELVSTRTHENGLAYHENYLGKKLRFTIFAVLGIIAFVILVSAISLFIGNRRRARLSGK